MTVDIENLPDCFCINVSKDAIFLLGGGLKGYIPIRHWETIKEYIDHEIKKGESK